MNGLKPVLQIQISGAHSSGPRLLPYLKKLLRRLAIGRIVCKQLRHAYGMERALFALRVQNGRRSIGSSKDRVKPAGRHFGLFAKSRIEWHWLSAFGFDEKDGAGRDFDAEHFFESHRLGAELDFVVIPAFTFASLIFHRERDVAGKFDEIANADDAQAMRNDPEPATRAPGGKIFVAFLVDAAMVEVGRSRVYIFLPNPFDAMEKTATLAEQQVIERREGRIGF